MLRATDAFLRSAEQSCRDLQCGTLHRLLTLNQGTRFAKDHGLAARLTVDEFRARVPVTDHEYYRTYIEQMRCGQHQALLGRRNPLLMYAVTSGTTSEAKLIPVTRQFVRDYRRGWQFWGMGVYRDHPSLSLLKIVQIVSSHERWRTEDGIPCGNISGLAASMQKRVVRKLYATPPQIVQIENQRQKIRTVAAFALAEPWLGMVITANPSTLLQLMQIAQEDADQILKAIHDGRADRLVSDAKVGAALRHLLPASAERASQLSHILESHGTFQTQECWPAMQCLGVWTGGSAGAWLPQLRQAFPNTTIRDHGLHASEGRMTIPFQPETPDGILTVDTHFFEFIPVEEADSATPNVLLAHELQQDRDYLILLTTSSGFCRYNIRDVVRCTGFHGTTPVLRFLHKGAHMSSITGEKITESQVVDAVRAAAVQADIRIQRFTMTPVWDSPPAYTLFIEILSDEVNSGRLNRLRDSVEAELCRLNCEYDEKLRSERLGPLRVQLLPERSWDRFQQNRLSTSGGSPEQYKHPFLLPDTEFSGQFHALAEIAQSSP